MRPRAPLAIAVLLAGCTLAWTERLPTLSIVPPARGIAERVELTWARDGRPSRSYASWRELLQNELLAEGTIASTAPIASPSLLRLTVDRELDTSVVSLLLNIATAFLWPHHETLRLRVEAVLLTGEQVTATSTSDAELSLRTSLAFLFYPPAWRSLDDAKLELPEVKDALRACLRSALVELGGGIAVNTSTVPVITVPAPPACASCKRPTEAGWLVCPWCGAKLR